MKLLMESWRGYLSEIGGATLEPYSFSQGYSSPDNVTYNFNSASGTRVRVIFERAQDGPWMIDFMAEVKADGKNPFGGMFTKGLTGSGEPLKVMSTIVAIIKKFIKSDKSRDEKRFMFFGIGKGVTKKGVQSTRTKLYLKFLKKNMPPGTIVTQGKEINSIYFTLPSGDTKE